MEDRERIKNNFGEFWESHVNYTVNHMWKKTIIMLENKNRMQQVENELLNF